MDLSTVAIISISMAVICAVSIAVDLFTHPQKMWIMNVVWPLTGLYAGPLALYAYWKIGRNTEEGLRHHAGLNPSIMNEGKRPFWQSVLKGALHCGSGCTLGDLISVSLLMIFPVTLFGSKLYGEWAIDFVVAFFIGILFQYFAIKPMGNLSRGQAISAALKADTLSLTSWQIGMYGWMAICDFLIFGHLLKASTPIFWLMMQVAMLFGLVTAFPVNWWLIKKGIKEAM